MRAVQRHRFVAGTWPFGVVEAIWAGVAVRRYAAPRRAGHRPRSTEGAAELRGAYNERVQPFVWTKTAEDIPIKATKHQRTSGTLH